MITNVENNDIVNDIVNKGLIVITGPTASGKTETAVELAKMIDGEVISADSMQIYKYMDIGTAKPDEDEMQGVKHYLIDELYPDEPYSAVRFKQMAERAVDLIRQRGKIPIIAGGSGFYINALLNVTDFTETTADTEFRNEMENYAREFGNGALHRKLLEIDPEAAEAIHQNNVKRVVRALEYYRQTGSKISEHNKTEKSKPAKVGHSIFILSMERGRLYEKINLRVDEMIKRGLTGEVAGLLDMGYGEGLISMQGLGYKELVPYIKGQTGLDEAVDELKKRTRHFAKRQLTWFNGQCAGNWLETEGFESKKDLARFIYNMNAQNISDKCE